MKEFLIKEGDRVKVKGLDGVHVVTRPFSVSVPSVVENQFALVEVVMVKFITKERGTYYAYGKDCSPVAPEVKTKAKK